MSLRRHSRLDHPVRSQNHPTHGAASAPGSGRRRRGAAGAGPAPRRVATAPGSGSSDAGCDRRRRNANTGRASRGTATAPRRRPGGRPPGSRVRDRARPAATRPRKACVDGRPRSRSSWHVGQALVSRNNSLLLQYLPYLLNNTASLNVEDIQIIAFKLN